MFCKNCGQYLEDGQQFCSSCGTPISMMETPTEVGGSVADDAGLVDIFKFVVFENYANFNGRARRREYWMFYLATAIISLAFEILTRIFADTGFGVFLSIIFSLYGLAIFVPNLALTWRRLHDVGKSGAYFFMNLIPIVGPILVLVKTVTDSQPHTNEYGPCPKHM